MLIELINDSDLTFQLDGEWLKAGEFKSDPWQTLKSDNPNP